MFPATYSTHAKLAGYSTHAKLTGTCSPADVSPSDMMGYRSRSAAAGATGPWRRSATQIIH